MDKKWIAAGSMLLGAVLFSAKAVFVKLAYQYDVNSSSLLALRMMFALPFYLIVATYFLYRSKKPISPTNWAGIAFLGVAGYYLASLFDFIGLTYISAGMERIILFAYPTIVVIITALWYREKITQHQVLALIITYFGIGITFSEKIRGDQNPDFFLGASFVFLAAITYAIYLVGSGRLLPKMGTWLMTSLAMIFACLAIIIHHTITDRLQLWDFHPNVYLYAFLMAFISTVLPTFLVSESIRIIGASNAAIIGSVGPISTIIMAYFFLGETLSMAQMMGTVVVISGVLMITLKSKSSTSKSTQKSPKHAT